MWRVLGASSPLLLDQILSSLSHPSFVFCSQCCNLPFIATSSQDQLIHVETWVSARFLLHSHSLSMFFGPGILPDIGDTRAEKREPALFRCQTLNHKVTMTLKNLRVRWKTQTYKEIIIIVEDYNLSLLIYNCQFTLLIYHYIVNSWEVESVCFMVVALAPEEPS